MGLLMQFWLIHKFLNLNTFNLLWMKPFALESLFIVTRWISDYDTNNDRFYFNFEKSINNYFPPPPHIPYLTIDHTFFFSFLIRFSSQLSLCSTKTMVVEIAVKPHLIDKTRLAVIGFLSLLPVAFVYSILCKLPH